MCFAFQAPPSYALALRRLGFDLVNQANNHSMDFGASGRAQTVAALDRAGIAHTGFPGEITYLRANGIRVAFLGFAPYASDANLLDIAGARALVRRARRHAAIVVVIIHAGAEGADQLHTPYGTQFYLGENRGDARAFAHAVIDAGASIVLGSGPHVIRGVERYRGRLIAYSLGNFVGYHTLAGGGVLDDSAILRATLGPPRPRAGGPVDPDHPRRRAAAPRSHGREHQARQDPLRAGLPDRPLEDPPRRRVPDPGTGPEVTPPTRCAERLGRRRSCRSAVSGAVPDDRECPCGADGVGARAAVFVRKGQWAGRLAGGCFARRAEDRRAWRRASAIRPKGERGRSPPHS